MDDSGKGCLLELKVAAQYRMKQHADAGQLIFFFRAGKYSSCYTQKVNIEENA